MRALLPRVYPRACGGTVLFLGDADQHVGLSPRMRGNLVARQIVTFHVGSIPAHAGEPL